MQTLDCRGEGILGEFVVELLRAQRMESVRVFVGGIIPAQDIAELKQLGIAEVFLPGASTQDVVRAIAAPSLAG